MCKDSHCRIYNSEKKTIGNNIIIQQHIIKQIIMYVFNKKIMQPSKIMLKKAYDIMFNGVKRNRNCIYFKNTAMKNQKI